MVLVFSARPLTQSFSATAAAAVLMKGAGSHVPPGPDVTDSLVPAPSPPQAPELHPLVTVGEDAIGSALSHRVRNLRGDIVSASREGVQGHGAVAHHPLNRRLTKPGATIQVDWYHLLAPCLATAIHGRKGQRSNGTRRTAQSAVWRIN
jgi:hypothetical protein